MTILDRFQAALAAFMEPNPDVPPGVDPARLDAWMKAAIAASAPFNASDIRYEAARLADHAVIVAFSTGPNGELYTTVAKGENSVADYLVGKAAMPEDVISVWCERETATAFRIEVQRRANLRLVQS